MPITFEAYTDKPLTARLHRAPRVRMRDTAGVALILHRAPQLLLTGQRHVSTSARLHRRPQVRLIDRSGGVLLVHRSPQLTLSGSAPMPSASVFNLAQPSPQVRLSSTLTRQLSMAFHRTPRLLLADAARFVVHRTPHMLLRDGIAGSDRTALLFQQPELLASMIPGLTVPLGSTLALSDQPSARLIHVLRASLALQPTPHALVEVLRAIEVTLGLRTFVDHALAIALHDTLGLHADTQAAELRLLALIDTLVLTGAASSQAEATAALATVLALHEALDTPTLVALASQWSLTGGLDASIEAYAAALSALRVTASASGALVLTLLLADTLGLHAVPSSTAELMRLLASAISASVRLSTGDEPYTAWVMDAGTKAVWTYANYPFNSFATLNDTPYAMGPEGLFELNGADDNGDAISWRARTGLSNLGTMLLKRPDAMYLGMTSAGTVGLSVIVVDPVDGEKVQYNYTLPARTAANVVNDRLKLGHGIETVYFAFEFAGTGPFTLNDAQLLPLRSGRRK